MYPVNVGTTDRLIRAFIGVLLVTLPYLAGFTTPFWTVSSILYGLVMLAVAVTRICPLYTMLGIRTTSS